MDIRNTGKDHTVEHPEFLLTFKLQYQCTRVNRVLEAMCLTHFIIGAHLTMINQFDNLRMNSIQCFLQVQRRTKPQLAAMDTAISGALERMDRIGSSTRDRYQH